MYPKLDTEVGGTNDIYSELYQFDYLSIYTVERKLDTGDAYDTPLKIDRPYFIKWAFGVFDENGNPAAHAIENSGTEVLIITEDYQDRNHDDWQKYGPWTDEFVYKDFQNNYPDLYQSSQEIEEKYGNIEDYENYFVVEDNTN